MTKCKLLIVNSKWLPDDTLCRKYARLCTWMMNYPTLGKHLYVTIFDSTPLQVSWKTGVWPPGFMATFWKHFHKHEMHSLRCPVQKRPHFWAWHHQFLGWAGPKEQIYAWCQLCLFRCHCMIPWVNLPTTLHAQTKCLRKSIVCSWRCQRCG